MDYDWNDKGRRGEIGNRELGQQKENQNVKVDWLFDDMELLIILFSCGNNIVIMFVVSPNLLDIYT